MYVFIINMTIIPVYVLYFNAHNMFLGHVKTIAAQPF